MKSSEENDDSDPENPSVSEGDNKKRNSVLKATMRKMRSYYKNKFNSSTNYINSKRNKPKDLYY